MRSSSSASSSSSSSYDSHYYSAIPSPSTKEFAHDGLHVFRDDIRIKSSAAAAAPSSSFSSSLCSSFSPSPSSRENAHRSEDDSSLRSRWSTSRTSSANPSPSISHHDVFISFRGQDTRNGFVSHLRAAFTRLGIKTYMDYDLERGNEISSSLLVAIKQSKILLIVFSENYAESRWTMDELTKIMECKRAANERRRSTRPEQHVIPIFYKVRPSDVRNQRGSYETAFKQHKKLVKANNDTLLQQWTKAMTEAANLSGWECSGSRSEAELVEEIAEDVMRKLESIKLSIASSSDEPESPQGESHQNYSSGHHQPKMSGESSQEPEEEPFPNKCLSNHGGSILGNVRDALLRRENERLVVQGKERPDEPSTSHGPRTIVYRLFRFGLTEKMKENSGENPRWKKILKIIRFFF